MNHLRVLTYNTGLYRVRVGGMTLVEPIRHHEARVAQMAEAIRSVSPDVIALQEVFDDRHLFPLIEALKSEYPYIVTGRDAFTPTFFSDHSGLCLLSRFPLRDVGHEKLRDAALEEWMFIVKGFQSATIDSPIGPVSIINTHLTSGGLFRDPQASWMVKIRDKQVDHLIELCAVMPNPIRLLVGDMNTGPEFATQNYERFIKGGLIDTWHHHPETSPRKKEVTWEITNPLNSRELHKTGVPQRIDHAFIHPESLKHVRIVRSEPVLTDPRVITPEGLMTVSDHYGLLIEISAPEAA
ncbi:MAG: endonuclease/exonuclease/phosphatase family protein [Patescibacteria group bacterium]